MKRKYDKEDPKFPKLGARTTNGRHYSILPLWPRIIAVVPYYRCGPVLSLWSRVIAVVPYCRCGPELSLWSRIIAVVPYYRCGPVLSLWSRIVAVVPSSNGAPWARPGAMPRGPKGGFEFCAPLKKGPGSVAHFLFFNLNFC